MARGTQFLTLVTRVKDETSRSNDVAVGVDDLPSIKRRLNRTYNWLYMQHTWPHLRKVFSKSLSAGQRYYDFPSGLNVERVEDSWVDYNDLPRPCPRGIDVSDYGIYDPDDDERSDPVLKWDVRWTGSSEQIEVWPLPATAQTLKWKGIQSISPLVNDSDTCLLDDELVVGFTAAQILKKQDDDDWESVLAEAQDLLRRLKIGGQGGLRTHQLGLGHMDPLRPNKAVIVVAS